MRKIKLSEKEEKDLFLKVLFGSPFFNIFASVLATFLTGAIFLKLGGGVPINVTQTSVTKTSTFDVEGEGVVMAKPDVAVVYLEVRKQSRDVGQAQREVEKIEKDLLERLDALGVKKDDVKTVSYYVYRDYAKKDLFNVSEKVKVKVRDIDLVERVLGLAGEVGLTYVDGPNFEFSNEKKAQYLHQAREEAVKQAKDKARELARLAGMKLGKIVNVKESVNGNRDIISVAGGEEIGREKISVRPGTSEIRVKLVVSWEVE